MRHSISSRVVMLAVIGLTALGCSGAGPRTGVLPGTARSIAMPGNQLWALANNPANWSAPFEAERDCVGAFGCGLFPPFKKRVKTDIYAQVDSRNVGPNPSTLTLVGKFRNKGNAKEAFYGLENGPYVFLMFVERGSGADGKWLIERVDNAPPHNHATVAEGKFVGCNHPGSWPSSFGDFRTCDDGRPPPRVTMERKRDPMLHTAGLGPMSFFSLSNISLLRDTGTDPAWYTCTSGCCVADAY